MMNNGEKRVILKTLCCAIIWLPVIYPINENAVFLHTYILIKVDRNLAVLKAFLNRRDTKINIYCRTMLQMELNHRRKDARVTDHLFCLSRN